MVEDSWLQVEDREDKAESQQGPYLGRLAFRASSWYWDWGGGQGKHQHNDKVDNHSKFVLYLK